MYKATLQRGFTMVEMIGVLAVIGILAAVATPRIIKAIRDAKVAAAVETTNAVRAAVAEFYKDTGRLPYHNDRSSNRDHHQLVSNTRRGISGWNGPYLEQRLENPIAKGYNFFVGATTSGQYRFDFDGDGRQDTPGTVAYLRIDVPSGELARQISNAIDGDGDRTRGRNAWYRGGRVKTIGGRRPGNGYTPVIVHMGNS